MAPTRNMVVAALALSMSLGTASPIVSSGNVDSAMPFLTEPTAWATSAQVWWTPDASQSQWDWKTWTQTPSASTAPVAVISTSLATVAESTGVASSSASSIAVVSSPASSEAYSNPFTIYTTMTNSLGVITGMPAVVTSQPSQAAKATECSGCASVLSAEASWSSMVSSLYSSTVTPAAASESASRSSSASGSAASSSSGFSQSTGAASRREVLSSGAVLAILGVVAYLL